MKKLYFKEAGSEKGFEAYTWNQDDRWGAKPFSIDVKINFSNGEPFAELLGDLPSWCVQMPPFLSGSIPDDFPTNGVAEGTYEVQLDPCVKVFGRLIYTLIEGQYSFQPYHAEYTSPSPT